MTMSNPFTDAEIKYMANRFLMWRLPDHFHPDNGIKFVPLNPWHTDDKMRQAHWPVGTNLFNADQAEAMVRHMIEGLPALSAMPAGDGEMVEALRKIERRVRNIPDHEEIVRRAEEYALALVSIGLTARAALGAHEPPAVFADQENHDGR